jgi:LysM repeat protein
MTTASLHGFPASSVLSVPPMPLRLTRRGRLVLLLLCAAVAALIGIAVPGTVVADEPGIPVTTKTIVVLPGDTLWDIARRVAPAEDPRATVYEIRRLNGLAGADIRVGEELVVPVP